MAYVDRQGAHGEHRGEFESRGLAYRAAHANCDVDVGESERRTGCEEHGHGNLGTRRTHADESCEGHASFALRGQLSGHRRHWAIHAGEYMRETTLDPQTSLLIEVSDVTRAMPPPRGIRTMLRRPATVVAVAHPRAPDHDLARDVLCGHGVISRHSGVIQRGDGDVDAVKWASDEDTVAARLAKLVKGHLGERQCLRHAVRSREGRGGQEGRSALKEFDRHRSAGDEEEVQSSQCLPTTLVQRIT